VPVSCTSPPTPVCETPRSTPARPRGRGLAIAASALPSICAIALLALAATAAAAETDGAGAIAGKWSQPALLSGCPGSGAPHVVFPSDSPTSGTGPGAIVWSVTAPCPSGAGVLAAPISAEDLPGQPAAPRTASGATIELRGPVAATGGPYGRVVIAGAAAGGHVTPAGELLLTEGPAGGPFAAPLALGGPASTFAFATAYLGDVALASLGDVLPGPVGPHDGGRGDLQAGHAGSAHEGKGVAPAMATQALQLRVQRHHAYRFAAPAVVSATGASPVQALTVALDFRSDRLVVFSWRGSLFARELPGKGAPHALQRLGPSPPSGARVAAVISDDDRAIVAWTVGHGGRTSVYVSRSQPGVRFTAPQLLEEFPDPAGLPGYVDSPQIVRLSSESVMLAWTGAVAGYWAIRAAAIDLNGILPPSTISPAGRDALLAEIAPGPNDEALALWSEPQPTAAGLDLGSQAIFAARGFDGYPEQVKFAAPELIAAPGPNSDATVAFDPDSDRAVAAWRTGAGALAYAIRAPGAP
jgi:hypothetical protein